MLIPTSKPLLARSAKFVVSLENPLDVDDIIKGIEWFYYNSDLAFKKTIEGKKYVNENYSVSVISNKWRRLIEKLI